jgi:CRP/FNR family cyclic AMP-dependent transcriptional regulator
LTVAIEQIDRCPALQDLPRVAKQALAHVARELTFEKDERLVPILRPPSRVLIILEGLAKLVGVTPEGVERILYVFHPCEMTGSRILLDESSEAPYEIVAMEKVHALSITKSDFMAVVRDHPEVLIAVTKSFAQRLENLTNRMLASISAEVPVRLSKLLLDFAERDGLPPDRLVPLQHPLTHETMAQIIGASRPHTSTVLRDLEEAGAVQRKSSNGLLVRPSQLEQILSRGIKPT